MNKLLWRGRPTAFHLDAGPGGAGGPELQDGKWSLPHVLPVPCIICNACLHVAKREEGRFFLQKLWEELEICFKGIQRYKLQKKKEKVKILPGCSLDCVHIDPCPPMSSLSLRPQISVSPSLSPLRHRALPPPIGKRAKQGGRRTHSDGPN